MLPGVMSGSGSLTHCSQGLCCCQWLLVPLKAVVDRCLGYGLTSEVILGPNSHDAAGTLQIRVVCVTSGTILMSGPEPWLRAMALLQLGSVMSSMTPVAIEDSMTSQCLELQVQAQRPSYCWVKPDLRGQHCHLGPW